MRQPTLSQQQGFTLLEILLVVVIVGVMASLATLSIPSADFNDELEREARKIAAQTSLLQDEAIVQSRELGIRVWQNGYRFWGWLPQQGWQPLSDDLDFQPHVLPINSEISLTLNGQPVLLDLVPNKGFPNPSVSNAGTNTQPDFNANLPSIVLYSSGEATPFELTLNHPDADQEWKIEGNIIGQHKISSALVAE